MQIAELPFLSVDVFRMIEKSLDDSSLSRGVVDLGIFGAVRIHINYHIGWILNALEAVSSKLFTYLKKTR